MSYTTEQPNSSRPLVIIQNQSPWYRLVMYILIAGSALNLSVPSVNNALSGGVASILGAANAIGQTQRCLESKRWFMKWQCLRPRGRDDNKIAKLGLDDHQQQVIEDVIATGERMGASDEDIEIAIATCLVETQCKELDESVSDRDSRGPFQQRPSQGWTDSKDTGIQATAFFSKLRTASGPTPGLKAQDVQRSAFPYRYDERMAEAKNILDAFRSTIGGYRIETPFLYDQSPPGSWDFTLVNPTTGSNAVPVPAPCSGRITESGWGDRPGNYVRVDCNRGSSWYFAHFQERDVEVGDWVTKGQSIGIQGSTGNSTGAHVHLVITPEGGDRTNRGHTKPLLDQYFEEIKQ